MDSYRRSAQIERLEVVDTGRRRRWSEDEKLKIVLESLQTPRQVAAEVWRFALIAAAMATVVSPRAEGSRRTNGLRTGDGGRGSDAWSSPVGRRRNDQIEFAAGARMRITGTVDAATLKAAVAALADGRAR